MKTVRFAFVLATALILPFLAVAAHLPDRALNPELAAPIQTWDEAIPLGNGTMGVLLWGETNRLRLSLDRGDLWDERPSKQHVQTRDRFNWRTMQQFVASNRMAEFHDVFDANYDYNGPPTKLPAGRLEITLAAAQSVEAFALNLASAEGVARLKSGGEVRVFVNAAVVPHPVALAEDFRQHPPRVSPAEQQLRFGRPEDALPRARRNDRGRW